MGLSGLKGPRFDLGFRHRLTLIWEFPKIRGTFFWGPYNKDPTIFKVI